MLHSSNYITEKMLVHEVHNSELREAQVHRPDTQLHNKKSDWNFSNFQAC